MLVITEHGILTIGPNHAFSINTFIAFSGATCHMRVSLAEMTNLRPYVIVVIVGNNETMARVSNGYDKRIVFNKKYGTFMDHPLQAVLFIPKSMVSLFTLTKAIETKGDTLSSKAQLISLLKIEKSEFFDHISNLDQEVFFKLKCILHPITLLPLHRRWTSMLFITCLVIKTQKS
jgi:hypothetical protein